MKRLILCLRALQIYFVILLALCSSNAIYLDCDYSIRNVSGFTNAYTCIAGFRPSSGNRDVLDVSQNHIEGYNNSDVTALIINESIAFAPHNVYRFFPNLVLYTIFNKNTSELARESLAGLKSLIGFDFGLNNLRIIEEDLFIDNPVINWIYFDNNPIQHVAFNVFDRPQLNYLYLNDTICIDGFSRDDPVTLDILKFRITVNCPPTFEMLERRIINGNLLQNIIALRIESEVEPMRTKLHEIEEEQRLLIQRVEDLELRNTTLGLHAVEKNVYLSQI